MEPGGANPTGAEKEREAGVRLSWRASFIPLLGLMAGGFLGKLLAGAAGFTEPVKSALGPVLGPFLTSSDNLILFVGLAGLILGAGVAAKTKTKQFML